MENGRLSVPETTERLSVSQFTVVWLIKAGELKEQRKVTRKAPVPNLNRRAWCRRCSVAVLHAGIAGLFFTPQTRTRQHQPCDQRDAPTLILSIKTSITSRGSTR